MSLVLARRIEAGLDLKRERAPRRPGEHELRRARLERAAIERLAVQPGGDEHKFVAVEFESRALASFRVGTHRERRDDARRMDVERHVEFDMVDEIVGDAIVAEANGLTDRCAHGARPFEILRVRGRSGRSPADHRAGVNASP